MFVSCNVCVNESICEELTIREEGLIRRDIHPQFGFKWLCTRFSATSYCNRIYWYALYQFVSSFVLSDVYLEAIKST